MQFHTFGYTGRHVSRNALWSTMICGIHTYYFHSNVIVVTNVTPDET